jgi:hypothetical protein
MKLKEPQLKIRFFREGMNIIDGHTGYREELWLLSYRTTTNVTSSLGKKFSLVKRISKKYKNK